MQPQAWEFDVPHDPKSDQQDDFGTAVVVMRRAEQSSEDRNLVGPQNARVGGQPELSASCCRGNALQCRRSVLRGAYPCFSSLSRCLAV